ncbi:MAG: acetoacetate decarboxylase family protein [Sandaracinaceae bacterium]|nr:acetoacetate decarboxylase family protein [Sandaracinaceae bacterium]
MKSYPNPPWATVGYAVLRAYRTPTSAITLPPGLKPVSHFGQSIGLFGFIRYTAPSPLEYAELIWLPTHVEAKGRRGYFVERMHVDCERSLEAGRVEWGLPKTLAHFDEEGEKISIETEDGSKFALRFRGFGPALPQRGLLATLQARGEEGEEILRFSSKMKARVSPATLKVESMKIAEPGWESFRHARPLPFPAVMLRGFHATMNPAKIL